MWFDYPTINAQFRPKTYQPNSQQMGDSFGLRIPHDVVENENADQDRFRARLSECGRNHSMQPWMDTDGHRSKVF
jgi:hypothetical protein